MRRQFYESRGEEVPDGMDLGDVSEFERGVVPRGGVLSDRRRRRKASSLTGGIDDEHARALEEQWIEGDLTAETATSKSYVPR